MEHSLHTILAKMFSDRSYSCSGETLKDVVWHDNLPPITQEEIDLADQELYKFDYIPKRQEEYTKRGATIQNLVVAVWEKIVENDSTDADALQLIRVAVQRDIPKPPQ